MYLHIALFEQIASDGWLLFFMIHIVLAPKAASCRPRDPIVLDAGQKQNKKGSPFPRQLTIFIPASVSDISSIPKILIQARDIKDTSCRPDVVHEAYHPALATDHGSWSSPTGSVWCKLDGLCVLYMVPAPGPRHTWHCTSTPR